MPKSQFESVRLDGDTVHVNGPLELDPAEGKVGLFRFLIAQNDVVVEGKGVAASGAWSGEAGAQGLEPGNALGFGVVVLVKGQAPDFETFTWTDSITVSG